MKSKKVDGTESKVKRQSKSWRKHIRRMKQAERKGGIPLKQIRFIEN